MKKALLFISALIVSGAAVAQTDGKNAVVNVENDYTPEDYTRGLFYRGVE